MPHHSAVPQHSAARREAFPLRQTLWYSTEGGRKRPPSVANRSNAEAARRYAAVVLNASHLEANGTLRPSPREESDWKREAKGTRYPRHVTRRLYPYCVI